MDNSNCTFIVLFKLEINNNIAKYWIARVHSKYMSKNKQLKL